MEPIRRFGAVLYGAACYALFFATFLYLIGFIGNFAVPKTIDSGVPESLGWSLLVDFGLLALFGVQHSVMARPGFKRWFTQLVPRSVERSTYVLLSSVILIVMMWQWRPIPNAIFAFEGGFGFAVMTALYFLGYGIVLYSTFLIDHFDLFGLRQVFLRAMGRPYTEKRFKTPSLYKLVRHPLYLGWAITFWAAPVFSVGHLLLASVWTGYMALAVRYEERDLADQLGEPYKRWRERTPAVIPRFRSSDSAETPVVRQVG